MPTTITGNPATSHGDPISFTAPADGETANAASVDSPYQAAADVIAQLQRDAVFESGNQTIAGTKTFTGAIDATGATVAVAVAASAAQPIRKDTFDAAMATNIVRSGGHTALLTSTSPADMTGLTVTITTRGKPVLIALCTAGTGPFLGNPGIFTSDAGQVINIELLRGSTEIYNATFDFSGAVATSEWPPPGTIAIDVPAAGTYTYKMRYAVNTGSGAFQNFELIAVELT